MAILQRDNNFILSSPLRSNGLVEGALCRRKAADLHILVGFQDGHLLLSDRKPRGSQ